jgi:hypothetical protein
LQKNKEIMKKNRITLTEDILKLVSAIKFREVEIPSGFNDGKYVIAVENSSVYGGSDLLEDVSRILGIYDQHIEGTEENHNGVQFPEEIENYIYDMHEFIMKHIIDIETLLHYYSNKGGLVPGTYNTITFERY